MIKDDDSLSQPPSRKQLARLTLDKIGPSPKQLESLKGHLALSPEVGEAARRMTRRQVADLRRPAGGAARAQLAEALDQLAALDREIAIQEERLAALRREAAGRREAVRRLQAWIARDAGPAPVRPADPPPIDPPRRPKEERPIDHARRAVRALWPEGDPGPDKLLLKTAVEDVNAWLADEARLGERPPPRSISPDTVSRALGRRK